MTKEASDGGGMGLAVEEEEEEEGVGMEDGVSGWTKPPSPNLPPP